MLDMAGLSKNFIMPAHVALAVDMLGRAGYEACVVGGCVRDRLLGLAPKDWDIATAATPGETEAVFRKYKLLTHGRKYGTVAVLFGGEPVEITTYRTDGDYLDSRRPESVRFTASLREDLGRRDFTINALAYRQGLGLVDYFGGAGDLAGGVVRCVGDARARFGEDALRIMRALRFAARFSFKIEEGTSSAVHSLRRSLENIALERVGAELAGILAGPGEGVRYVLSEYYDVMTVIIPELSDCSDSWENWLKAAAAAPPDLAVRLALMLCGLTAPAANGALRRLRFNNGTADEAAGLIDLFYAGVEEARQGEAAVKRLLCRAGEARLRKLLLARRAYAAAAGGNSADGTGGKNGINDIKALDEIGRLIDGVTGRGDCYSLKGLAVKGGDLIGLGFAPGKEMGRALQALLDLVIEGESPNERGALLAKAEAMK